MVTAPLIVVVLLLGHAQIVVFVLRPTEDTVRDANRTLIVNQAAATSAIHAMFRVDAKMMVLVVKQVVVQEARQVNRM